MNPGQLYSRVARQARTQERRILDSRAIATASTSHTRGDRARLASTHFDIPDNREPGSIGIAGCEQFRSTGLVYKYHRVDTVSIVAVVLDATGD